MRKAVEEGRLNLRAFDLSETDLEGLGTGFEGMATDLSGHRNPMGLEAIILRVGRPPMLIRKDRVMFKPVDMLPSLTIDIAQRIERYIPSVGRIEFVNHAIARGGTGFVAAASGNSRTVVTNRDVTAKGGAASG